MLPGQAGVNIPQSLSTVEYSAGGATLGGNDLSLHKSVMYGGKLGYYFDSLKFQNFNLGVETEVFSTPRVKQQDLTFVLTPVRLSGTDEVWHWKSKTNCVELEE